MCKAKRQEASRTEGKTYRKSNASVHHTCEKKEFEDPASTEETMYLVEQIATVEAVHHIASKAEFHDININGHEVRMQNDTGSSVTIISTNIGRENGSPTLRTSLRWIEAYDGHRMLYLGHLKCEIPWEKKIHTVDVAVIESEKDFRLIGRDVTRADHIHNASLSDVKILPALKGVKAIIKLKPDAKPVSCRARKLLLAMEDQVKIELAKFQAQGIIAPVDQGAVMNAWPVASEGRKTDLFGFVQTSKIM